MYLEDLEGNGGLEMKVLELTVIYRNLVFIK